MTQSIVERLRVPVALVSTEQVEAEREEAAARIAELEGALRFIRKGIERGKIDDANFVKPYDENAVSADVSCLSEMIDELLANKAPSGETP